MAKGGAFQKFPRIENFRKPPKKIFEITPPPAKRRLGSWI